MGRPSSRGLRAKAIPRGPPRAAHVPRGESEQQGGGKGVQGLTWRGTSKTKGSSAYQTWSSEEERDCGAQRKSVTQHRSPSREKSELPALGSFSPAPQYTHMRQSLSSSQSSLAHKPDSCLHTPCQAHRKSTRILRPNFPFAPRRRTLMKRP